LVKEPRIGEKTDEKNEMILPNIEFAPCQYRRLTRANGDQRSFILE